MGGKVVEFRRSPNGARKLFLVELLELSARDGSKKTKFFQPQQLRAHYLGLKVTPLVRAHRPDDEPHCQCESGCLSQYWNARDLSQCDNVASEKQRVESIPGGFVKGGKDADDGTLPRVMGQLATSRAFGALPAGLKQ